MFAKSILSITLLLGNALAIPRFGQENIPENLVKTFTLNNSPGCDTGTVGGQGKIQWLADTQPCGVIDVAQKVIDCGGTVNNARDLLALEKNFNPSKFSGASVCLDPAQPANQDLRGILPLVDPALPGAAAYNTASRARNQMIKDGSADGAALANGKSIADQMVDLGFTAIQGINQAKDASATANDAQPTTKTTGGTSCKKADKKSNATANPDTSGSNLQTFQGAVEGIKALPVVKGNNPKQPFQVVGNSSFKDLQSALKRSCDAQMNKCKDRINGLGQNKGGASTSQCDDQKTKCDAVASSA